MLPGAGWEGAFVTRHTRLKSWVKLVFQLGAGGEAATGAGADEVGWEKVTSPRAESARMDIDRRLSMITFLPLKQAG